MDEMSLGVHQPQFHPVVVGSRDDHRAIRAEIGTRDLVGMTLKGLNELTIAHPPQFHCSVVGRGDDLSAIGAEISTHDWTKMTLKGLDELTIAHPP